MSDGLKRIEWAEKHMPVVMKIRARFEKERPLDGQRIACCLHVTKETAVLMRTLKAGGAEVALCASNPLSTQDDVAAQLNAEGIPAYAKKGCSTEEYYVQLNKALDLKPTITIDDGADLINAIHSKRTDLIKNIIGGQEETTTGVIRLKAMAKEGKLLYPVIAINDTPTKHLFDNRYGTGQSTLDGLIRGTEILLAGKEFVVAGYGWCGRGLALRARGMGALVTITEIDSVKALEAFMDGFTVKPMIDAVKTADVVITATGCKDVLTKKHFEAMKDGCIIANTGHFDVEINIPDLEKIAQTKQEIRDQVREYVISGKRVYLVAEGRLINLACATGHPSEVMDQSFANQALCSEHIARHKLPKGVHDVPRHIDDLIANLKLETEGIKIDVLTPQQKEYLAGWSEGT